MSTDSPSEPPEVDFDALLSRFYERIRQQAKKNQNAIASEALDNADYAAAAALANRTRGMYDALQLWRDECASRPSTARFQRIEPIGENADVLARGESATPITPKPQ